LSDVEAPTFIDNPFTDGGKVVSLTRWPHFTPTEVSWYSFLLEAESTPGHSAAGSIRSTEKSNGLIGNRTHDLPACNSASSNYATEYPLPLVQNSIKIL
jgi:hypothetical protein